MSLVFLVAASFGKGGTSVRIALLRPCRARGGRSINPVFLSAKETFHAQATLISNWTAKPGGHWKAVTLP